MHSPCKSLTLIPLLAVFFSCSSGSGGGEETVPTAPPGTVGEEDITTIAGQISATSSVFSSVSGSGATVKAADVGGPSNSQGCLTSVEEDRDNDGTVDHVEINFDECIFFATTIDGNVTMDLLTDPSDIENAMGGCWLPLGLPLLGTPDVGFQASSDLTIGNTINSNQAVLNGSIGLALFQNDFAVNARPDAQITLENGTPVLAEFEFCFQYGTGISGAVVVNLLHQTNLDLIVSLAFEPTADIKVWDFQVFNTLGVLVAQGFVNVQTGTVQFTGITS